MLQMGIQIMLGPYLMWNIYIYFINYFEAYMEFLLLFKCLTNIKLLIVLCMLYLLILFHPFVMFLMFQQGIYLFLNLKKASTPLN